MASERFRDRDLGDTLRPDADVVAAVYRSLNAGAPNEARRLGGLPRELSDALTGTLARAFLREPVVVARVADAFGYQATGKGHPGPLIRSGPGFALRWPRNPTDEIHDVLTVFNILCTDCATLLHPVYEACRDCVDGTPPADFTRPDGSFDLDAVVAVMEKAWHAAVAQAGETETMYHSIELARLLAHRLVKLWQTSVSKYGTKGTRAFFPVDHYWWLGVYLLSIDWRNFINTNQRRRRPAEDLVAIFAFAKRGLFGRQLAREHRHVQRAPFPVGWSSVERRLRDGTAPDTLNWRLVWSARDFDNAVVHSLRVALADDAVIEMLRDQNATTVLGYRIGADLDEDEEPVVERPAGDSVATFLAAAIPAQRLTPDVVIDLAATAVDAEAEGRAEFAAMPDLDDDRVHTRTAALLWSSGEAAWRERGRRWMHEWTAHISAAPLPSLENAQRHLHERLDAALALEPAFRAYLRRAFVFPVIPALFSIGFAAIMRLLLMNPVAHPIPAALIRAVGALPLLALSVTNAGWAHARRLPKGMTPMAVIASGVALPVGMINGRLLVALATLPVIAVGTMWWLRRPWQPRRKEWLGSQDELDDVRTRRSTASRVINGRLERATVFYGADGVVAIPAVVGLAVNPYALAQRHPSLLGLARDVHEAEYGTFARYRRWAEAIAYCRLSRMPGADYAIRHSGAESLPAPALPSSRVRVPGRYRNVRTNSDSTKAASDGKG